MDKEDVIRIYKGILFSHKKNNAICNNTDGLKHYHTKYSKPERQISYHLHVESKIWHKWNCLQNRNRLTENRLLVARSGRRWGRTMDWEFRVGRRQWHPTPVLLPGKSHGWRSLVGCSPWGHIESDTTERLPFHFSLSCIGEGNGNPLQCSCLENPRDGEPGGLPSVGLHRVGHDWSNLAAADADYYI